MACERCGRCCHDFGMYVADDDDIARLFSYHGFETEPRPEGIYVKGSNPCRHLQADPMACGIYEDRPLICQKFLCEKARKGMELSRELLLERMASLEDNVKQLEDVISQASADLHANRGALQQVAWTLEQMDATEEVAPPQDD